MSLTANELRLMMERGSGGYLYCVLNNKPICGKIPGTSLERTYDWENTVTLMLTNGAVVKVPKLILFSATAAQVDAAFTADAVERQRAKEARIARPAAPVKPFRPPVRAAKAHRR